MQLVVSLVQCVRIIFSTALPEELRYQVYLQNSIEMMCCVGDSVVRHQSRVLFAGSVLRREGVETWTAR